MAGRPTVAELLPLLDSAQVLLVARRGWLSALIRRVTESRYSHSTLLGRTAEGVVYTLEAADADGVKALRFERYLDDESVTGLLIRDSSVLTPFERVRIMEAGWLRVEAKYDTWAIVGIYLRRRLPWLFGGRKKALAENRLADDGKFFCSELVSVAYKEGASLNLAPPHVAIGNVDPGMLATTTKLRDVWRWP